MENIAICIKNLKKKFVSFTAVNNISFDVYHDEIFGFLGPNGAGKTTTINMIYGVTQPTSGEIKIFGTKLKKDKTIRTQIGICPQENVFWPKLTAKEQLVFLGKMYGFNDKTANLRTDSLLELTGLKDKTNTLAKKLSGGMKRRLSIALALIHDPSILILDEPEAGLDPQSRILIRDFIKSLAKEKTVILTTHNMDEADRLADRVAIMNHGEILLIDTPKNLKKTIGKGDILEIRLEKNVDELNFNELKPLCESFKSYDNILVIKSKNLVEQIPKITKILSLKGLKILSMTIRENSLEDVFIHLTGKSLIQGND